MIISKEKYFSQLSEEYCSVVYPQSLSYIQAFYGTQLKVKSFLLEYRKYIEEQYTKINYKTYEELFNNFPFLGKLTARHSFYLPPLYRYLNLKEPQFTKALSKFLLENQSSCKAFLQAVFMLLNPEKKLSNMKFPETGYRCKCEVVTKAINDKKDKTHKNKRIDNVIIWNNHALCIEIKFDAEIDGNDLRAYELQMENTEKDKEINYVVISIRNIQKDIDAKKEKTKPWKNILWCDVMRLWEQNINQNSVVEDEDMRRYRSSLWNKILYWEC